MTPFAGWTCSRAFPRRRATPTPARGPRRRPATSELRSKPSQWPPASDGQGGFALNFENTPVGTVAEVVLGDILNVGYVIDPRAQGTISLSSGRPIAKSDMLFVLENALRVNNLVLLRDPVGYRILPATDGAVGAVDRPDANSAVEAGYGLTVIPVQYVSGSTLVKLMEGFASKPGTIRTDPTGKLLLVLGTGSERQTAIDTVRNFDVDWMRGQSVGIYPVYNRPPPRWWRNWKKSWTGRERTGSQSGEIPSHRATKLDSGRGLKGGIAASGGSMDFETGQIGGREHRGQGLSREIWRRETNGRASEQYFYRRGLDGPRVRPPTRSRRIPDRRPCRQWTS